VIAQRPDLQRRLDRATAHLETPLAVVDLAAFDGNAAALEARAGGKPIRVASKSVRCRRLLERVLDRPGWHGVMAYTLPEAIWLVRSGVSEDVLVAYPTVDRSAIAELAKDDQLAASIALMADHPAHLDLIDQVSPPGTRPDIRLCLELDASWRPAGSLHVGVRRSPVHSAGQAAALARRFVARPGFRLVGMMSYEAHIAGLGDAPTGQALRGRAIRLMQRRALPELLERRAAAVAAVREHADLEFVNGGGTGSLAQTAADPSVTEVAAGSGLYGPTLFDQYTNWQPTPAAMFALSVVRRVKAASVPELAERSGAVVAAVRELADLEFVNGGGTGSLESTAADPSVTEVAAGSGLFAPALFDGYDAFDVRPAAFMGLDVCRRPAPGLVTVTGGGWVASGPIGRDRLPVPTYPEGLKLLPAEGAGEVQTPLRGRAADALRLGDRVWFRHAKAGEMCEHIDDLHLMGADGAADVVPTYRGEGQTFI